MFGLQERSFFFVLQKGWLECMPGDEIRLLPSQEVARYPGIGHSQSKFRKVIVDIRAMNVKGVLMGHLKRRFIDMGIKQLSEEWDRPDLHDLVLHSMEEHMRTVMYVNWSAQDGGMTAMEAHIDDSFYAVLMGVTEQLTKLEKDPHALDMFDRIAAAYRTWQDLRDSRGSRYDFGSKDSDSVQSVKHKQPKSLQVEDSSRNRGKHYHKDWYEQGRSGDSHRSGDSYRKDWGQGYPSGYRASGSETYDKVRDEHGSRWNRDRDCWVDDRQDRGRERRGDERQDMLLQRPRDVVSGHGGGIYQGSNWMDSNEKNPKGYSKSYEKSKKGSEETLSELMRRKCHDCGKTSSGCLCNRSDQWDGTKGKSQTLNMSTWLHGQDTSRESGKMDAARREAEKAERAKMEPKEKDGKRGLQMTEPASGSGKGPDPTSLTRDPERTEPVPEPSTQVMSNKGGLQLQQMHDRDGELINALMAPSGGEPAQTSGSSAKGQSKGDTLDHRMPQVVPLPVEPQEPLVSIRNEALEGTTPSGQLGQSPGELLQPQVQQPVVLQPQPGATQQSFPNTAQTTQRPTLAPVTNLRVGNDQKADIKPDMVPKYSFYRISPNGIDGREMEHQPGCHPHDGEPGQTTWMCLVCCQVKLPDEFGKSGSTSTNRHWQGPKFLVNYDLAVGRTCKLCQDTVVPTQGPAYGVFLPPVSRNCEMSWARYERGYWGQTIPVYKDVYGRIWGGQSQYNFACRQHEWATGRDTGTAPDDWGDDLPDHDLPEAQVAGDRAGGV